MKTKICTKCGKEKELKEFVKDKTKNDGYKFICKKCHSSKELQRYDKIKDNVEFKENRSKYQKKYYIDNKSNSLHLI